MPSKTKSPEAVLSDMSDEALQNEVNRRATERAEAAAIEAAAQARTREEKQKVAYAQIEELTQKADALIKQAQAIADQTGTSFTFSVAYGMGGSYRPKGSEEFDSSGCSWNETRETGEWVSSSSNC